MLISGNVKRSLNDQTGNWSYGIDVSVNNTSGNSIFGFSGDYILDWEFKNGKILDTNKSFIGSYTENQLINISGNVYPDIHEAYINNDPLYFQKPKSTGKINYFFSNNDNIINNTNLFFYGEAPDYNITGNENYFSGSIITGRFINNNPFINFRVFSGSILNSSIPIGISGLDTGNISNTGLFYLLPSGNNQAESIVNLRFNTNFGIIDFPYNITGDQLGLIYGPDIYLNLVSSSASVISGVADNKYTISYSNPKGAILNISLKYLAGHTGEVYKETEVINNVSLISGNQIVTGIKNITGTLETGISGLNSTGIYQTGIGTGIVEGIQEATGNMDWYYTIPLTGLASGINETNVTLVSSQTYNFTGFIAFNGGELTGYLQDIPGTGIIQTTFGQRLVTGLIDNASGFINIPFYTGGVTGFFDIPSGAYQEKTLNLYTGWTGVISQNYALIASGFASGLIETGIIDENFLPNIKRGDYYWSKDYSVSLTTSDQVFFAGKKSEIVDGVLESAQNSLLAVSTGIATGFLEGSCIADIPSESISGIFNVTDTTGIELLSCVEYDWPIFLVDFSQESLVGGYKDLIKVGKKWEFSNPFLIQTNIIEYIGFEF